MTIHSLLFHTPNTFDLIFSLIEIGENARYEIDMRKSAPVRIEAQEVQQ